MAAGFVTALALLLSSAIVLASAASSAASKARRATFFSDEDHLTSSKLMDILPDLSPCLLLAVVWPTDRLRACHLRDRFLSAATKRSTKARTLAGLKRAGGNTA